MVFATSCKCATKKLKRASVLSFDHGEAEVQLNLNFCTVTRPRYSPTTVTN